MATSSAPQVVDPTKPEQFPIVLSDALLGKRSKEAFTGVRYNHKPTLSSETAPSTARIRPSNGSFELSFQDNGGKYAYTGTRNTKDDKYVLVFDPDRRVFVLHKMDSVFNMNLSKTPTNPDASSLRDEFPPIDTSAKAPADSRKAKDKAPSKPAVKAAAKAAAKPAVKPAARAKEATGSRTTGTAKKKAEKATATAPLSLPVPEAPKPTTTAPPPKKSRAPVDFDEEDDDSDDGGLVLEFPKGSTPSSYARPNDFSPAFPPPIRRFSEFARGKDEDGEDAQAEDEFEAHFEGDVEEEGRMGDFKLPSPVNNAGGARAEEEEDDEFDDIEAELMEEEESEVSEED